MLSQFLTHQRPHLFSHTRGRRECLWPSVILLTRAFNWDTFLHPTLGVALRYVICSRVTGKLCLTSAEMCKCLIRFNNYLLEGQFHKKISLTEKWKGLKEKKHCNWIITVLAELIHLSRNIFINMNNECCILKNTWMGYTTKRLSSSPWNQTQTVFSNLSSIQPEFIH